MENKPSDDPKSKAKTTRSSSRRSEAESAAVVTFDELAMGNKEVVIEFHGQLYRLRATRNGGLILNK